MQLCHIYAAFAVTRNLSFLTTNNSILFRSSGLFRELQRAVLQDLSGPHLHRAYVQSWAIYFKLLFPWLQPNYDLSSIHNLAPPVSCLWTSFFAGLRTYPRTKMASHQNGPPENAQYFPREFLGYDERIEHDLRLIQRSSPWFWQLCGRYVNFDLVSRLKTEPPSSCTVSAIRPSLYIAIVSSPS